MAVTRADLLTRLRNPAKATTSTQKTILLTSSVCADMKEAADEIEKLQGVIWRNCDPMAATPEDAKIIESIQPTNR
jgi:hypothetical protein